MKKLLAFMFVLCFAASAFAAKIDGTFYTAEVPEGWTAEVLNADDNSVSSMLKAPDNSMAFVVSVLKADKDLTVKTAAEQFAAIHNATDLKKMEGEGESYEYTAVVNGAKAYAQVFKIDDETIGNITIIGDHGSELAVGIFNSIEFKEPK